MNLTEESFRGRRRDPEHRPHGARAQRRGDGGRHRALRVTGFMRYAALAYVLGLTLQYGQTNLPSTYNLANSIPNMVYDLVVGASGLPVHPGLRGIPVHPVEGRGLLRSLLATNITLALLSLVTVVGIFASPLIIH